MAETGDTTRGRILLCGVVIAGAAAVAYANSLRVPFVFDDPLSIASNPTIRSLWPPWAALHPPRGSGLTVEGRPLLNLSFALNHAVGGTRVRGYHAANLIFHALAGLALFGILRRTFERWSELSQPAGSTRPDRKRVGDNSLHPQGLALPFLIALIWTVHPLQTESVTYLSQRAESLMGLFYLLTLYFFIRYVDGQGKTRTDATPSKTRSGPPSCVPRSGTSEGEQAGPRPWAWLSVGACLLGAATKEVIVTAPIVMLLYDRTFVAGSFRGAWRRRRGYYAALAVSWVLLGWLVLGAGNRGRTAGLGVGVSPWAYALTQPAALLHYLRLAAWPRPLVFDYGAEWVSHPADALPAALAVAALAAAAAWSFLRSPRAAGFAGLSFFLILAPTSLTPGIRQTLAEHRMYLPLAAVLAVGAAGLSALAGGGWRRRAVLALLAAYSASCLALTIGRNRDYATKVALYRDTLDKRPGNIFAWYNLAGALEEAGDHAGAAGLYREVVRREPGAPDAWLRLGKSLAAMGRLEEAASCLDSALRIRPNDAEAHRALGAVLLRLGRARDARWHLDAAARLDPGGVGSR